MTNKIKLIGLTGAAGCGKDTAALFLRDVMGFRQLSLAEPIRRGIVAMFGIPYEYLVDRRLKEEPIEQLCGKSPRQAMQTLGTEWGRNHMCLDIWLKVAQRDIDFQSKLAAAGNMHINGVVVSDIRFPGEVKWLKDQGGSLWLIERPNNPHAINTGHESENPIGPYSIDEVIINDGDIDKLHEKIEIMIEKMEVLS